MRPLLLIGIGLVLLLFAGLLLRPSFAEKDSQPLLRHVVLFRFKPEATKEQIEELEQAIVQMKKEIAEIHDLEWGINNSPENHSKGYTHCILVTFASEAGRAAYLPHPSHMKLVSLLPPILDDATVVDYWTKQ